MNLLHKNWILLVFLVFTITFENRADEKYSIIETENFQIYSNSSRNRNSDIAQNLEQFHQLIINNFSSIKFQKPFQTKIIVIDDNKEMENTYVKSNQIFSGLVSLNDANIGVIGVDKRLGIDRIYNRYAKFLFEQNVERKELPVWLSEGMSSLLSNCNLIKNNEFVISLSKENLHTLKEKSLFSIDILLKTDHFTFQKQGEDWKEIFRAQSAAFLMFLLQDKENFDLLDKFLFLKKEENSDFVILAKIFKVDHKNLDESFRKYISSKQLENKIFKFKGLPAKIVFEQKITASDEFLVQLSEYLYYSKQRKTAEEILSKVLQANPQNSTALSILALIKSEQLYYNEAEEFAETAVKNQPDNYLYLYRLALVLSKQGMTEYGFVSGYHPVLAEKIRQSLTKSINHNPNFLPAQMLLVFVNFVRNENLAESLKIIEKISRMLPGNEIAKIRLAEIYLRLENFSEARKNALLVFSYSSQENQRLYSQNTMDRIDSTEFQLERIRKSKNNNVPSEIVTEKPLREEEIRKLREKATLDQIKMVIRRPKINEKITLGNLKKIDCGKNKVDLFVETPRGLEKFTANSLAAIQITSLVEEFSDYRLVCGNSIKENNASIIYKTEKGKTGEAISIEFVPKGFKL